MTLEQITKIETSATPRSDEAHITWVLTVNGTATQAKRSHTVTLDFARGLEFELIATAKEAASWKRIVEDDCESDTDWRKTAGEWDKSDSYGVESPSVVIARILEEIERLKAALETVSIESSMFRVDPPMKKWELMDKFAVISDLVDEALSGVKP